MRVWAAAIVGVLLLVAACSSDPDVTAETQSAPTTTVPVPSPETSVAVAAADLAPVTTQPVAPFEPAAIEWEAYDDAVDVGTLEVPVDYSDPAGPTFELFLARYNALDQGNKVGTLLVNPGGPGFGGTTLAFTAATRFDRTLRERFDIIGWDPRGTGESDPPIDCIDDYDDYFTIVDGTPESDDERQALLDQSERYVAACQERSGAILPYVGTNASARDMDAIRRALGEETISYFGFSYGSELGAVWATLFPDTVRAAVLDGAADPGADPQQSTIQQYTAFEASLTDFLAHCSEDEGCAFHNDGDAEGAYDALMASLDASPIVGDPERPPVNRDVAIVATVLAMYSDDFWPTLAYSLAAAQEGDGSGLLAMFDAYYQRSPDGTWGNELEAFEVITCADERDHLAIEDTDALWTELHAVAPRLAPEGTIGGYTCALLPASIDPRVEVTGVGSAPIVVIGTTGDAATPLESTRAMSRTLADARLVVVDAAQHTGYGVNRCVIDLVNDYLVDLTLPDDGTECA
jgi:pimeloyl-ACP methyl ester carboxylesterase